MHWKFQLKAHQKHWSFTKFTEVFYRDSPYEDLQLRPFTEAGRPEACVLFLIVRLVKVYENSSAAEFFEKFVDASIVRW